MERNNSSFNIDTLPVHLLVKSPKQAKKTEKQLEHAPTEHVIFKKGKRLNP